MSNLLFDPPALGTVLALTGLPGGSNKIHDRSLYANNGTITGATWGRLPSGWCYLDFDGVDDYANCGAPGSIYSVTDVLTVEAWVRMDAASAAICRIVTAGDYATGLANDSAGENKVRFRFRTTVPNNQVSSYATLTPGEWTHLVGFYDGNNIALYKNAVQVSKASIGHFTISISGESVRLGYDAIAANRYLDGGIALARIYHGFPSVLEIARHYHQEKHLFGVC